MAVVFAVGFAESKAATISGFSPARGPAGTEVTILGSSLQNAIFVYFGSTDAPGEILARASNGVLVRVPANALTGQISVFTSGSGAASSSQFFVATPRVESFTPISGNPGTLVTLTGANFGTGIPGGLGTVTTVLFNGAPARFQIVGINQLVTIVPPDATSGPITVANDAGTLTTLLRFEMPALIYGFTPAAAQPGDTINIRGLNLANAIKVEFGLISAPFTAASPTNITVWMPTNAVNGRVQITTPAGTATSSSNVAVLPRIIRFTPASGPVGTAVSLEGGGFSGVTDVRFGNLHAAFTTTSPLRIDTLVPSGASSGPLVVVTTSGTFTTTTDFTLPASVSALAPANGKRGDLITVDGQNLRGATRVTLNGIDTAFSIVSASRLTFPVPPLATSGRVVVTTPSGDATSPGTLTVRPVLDGFSPSSGGVGSILHVLGAGFSNLAWVRLDGLDATFTLLDATDVRAIVPLGAFSGPVRIRTSDGSEIETAANFFVEGAKPSLASFLPASGAAGVKVTLQGSGLRSASKVQFNGADAAFTVKLPTQIEAIVPAAATSGAIAVTTLDGIALSSTSFVIEKIEVPLSAEVGPGTFTLRWPAAAAGFTLESTPRIGPDAVWQTVGQPPVVDGSDWRVTVVLPQAANRYFRLRR